MSGSCGETRFRWGSSHTCFSSVLILPGCCLRALFALQQTTKYNFNSPSSPRGESRRSAGALEQAGLAKAAALSQPLLAPLRLSVSNVRLRSAQKEVRSGCCFVEPLTIISFLLEIKRLRGSVSTAIDDIFSVVHYVSCP